MKKMASVLPRSHISTRRFFLRCCSVFRSCYSAVASALGWGKGSLPLHGGVEIPGYVGGGVHTVGLQFVMDRW